MTAESPAPQTSPNLGAQIYESSRPGWLTTAPQEIKTTESVVDPAALKLPNQGGGATTVPAIFEIPGPDGTMDKIAAVRHEVPGGPAQIALHGLVRNWRGREVVAGTGVRLPVVPEGEKPQHVQIGNQVGAVSRSQLFAKRSGKQKDMRPFSPQIGEDALDLMVTPQGGIFASSTTEGKVAHMQATTTTPMSVEGRVVIGYNDPRHEYYVSPQERAARKQAEELRLANVARAKQEAEAARLDKIIAPRNVPDITQGDQLPYGYKGLYVSEASRAYSRDWTRRALQQDSHFRKIVEAALGTELHRQEPDGTIDRAIDLMRTDAAVRKKLFEMYKSRVEFQLEHMEANIRSRNLKKPNSPGYEDLQMYGPEYAAILAVSHLDGTFNPGNESTLASASDFNAYGWPRIDQHRAAARYAIDGMLPRERYEQSRRRF